MSCSQAMAELSAAVDGELGPGRAGPLEEHLAGCPACRAFRDRVLALRRQLRFEPVGDVPDVAPRVLETIRAGGAVVAPRVQEELGSGGAAAHRSGDAAPHRGGVDNRTTAARRWATLPLRGARQPEPGVRAGHRWGAQRPEPGAGRGRRRGARQPERGVGAGRRRGMLPVAAAFLGGVVLGATFIGLGRGGPGQVAMADLPARVVAAQRELRSLAADVSLVERGWHPSVPERRFAGRLRWRAPEHLALELADRTAYPSAAWRRGDLALVVTGDRWWTRGQRACPVEALPGCAPPAPLVRLVERREPFADATPVPLDLVTPVRSFTPAGAGASLGHRRVAGRAAVGVATTAAQAAPLLAGLAPAGAGNLRSLHPSDRVELWLDEVSLVPLALRVTATSGDERRAWAAAHGYRDRPGQAVLELTLSRVSLNQPLEATAFPPPPAGTPAEDAGFRDAAAGGPGLPSPGWLPPGFRAHRSGVAGGAPEQAATGAGPAAAGRPGPRPEHPRPGPTVAVGTWTDGRAWVKVRATRDWPGGRLFGDLGPLVRPAGLGAGTAYWSEDGARVAVHGAGIDLVVTGSVGEADLARVAASLPVAGRPVPAGWAEAATSTLPEAVAADPGLRTPRDLAGFAPPAVRVDGRTVTLAYAGPGSRGFLLVQAPGDRLAPPLDDDPVGVPVRGTDGRWSPGRGELEWVEQRRVVTLRSTTVSLDELLAVAATLEPR
jgi:Putative zinc-finger